MTKSQIAAYEILETPAGGGWTHGTAMVRKVFRADPLVALPAKRIATIAKAMAGYDHTAFAAYEEHEIRPALRTLVRDKVLRSYRSGGTRYYEVNLPDAN